MKDNKNLRNNNNSKQKINTNKQCFKSKTDPQGSYTGTCKDPYEKPVQDADDL